MGSSDAGEGVKEVEPRSATHSRPGGVPNVRGLPSGPRSTCSFMLRPFGFRRGLLVQLHGSDHPRVVRSRLWLCAPDPPQAALAKSGPPPTLATRGRPRVESGGGRRRLWSALLGHVYVVADRLSSGRTGRSAALDQEEELLTSPPPVLAHGATRNRGACARSSTIRLLRCQLMRAGGTTH